MANILFLSHRIPFPPNKGDKIRSWNFLKRLAEDHSVHAGFFVDDPADERYIADLERVCKSVCAVPVSKTAQKLMSLRGLLTGKSLTEAAYPFKKLRLYASSLIDAGKIDCVFLFSAATAPIVFPDCKVPVVSDLVDVDSDKWDAYAKASFGPKKWVFAREARTLLTFEKKLIAVSHAAAFVSEDEALLMREKAPALKDKIFGVANGVDTSVFNPGKYGIEKQEQRLIFTGAMDYAPNIEAVSWFADNVWPAIVAKCPRAEFVIAGAPVAPKIAKLDEKQGISVTGFVDDMAAELAAATIAVAPLQTARGIQNKVLEAMAMYLPVIATTLANEGINAKNGKDVLIADSAQDFAEAVIELLSSNEKRTTIGANARDFVSMNFSWDQKYQELVKLLEEAMHD